MLTEKQELFQCLSSQEQKSQLVLKESNQLQQQLLVSEQETDKVFELWEAEQEKMNYR